MPCWTKHNHTIYHIQSNWKGPRSSVCSPISGGIIASSERNVINGSLDFECNSNAAYQNKTVAKSGCLE